MNALVRGGSDHMDCTSQSIETDFTANLEEGVKGMRIGIVPTFMEAEGLDAEVKERIEEAAVSSKPLVLNWWKLSSLMRKQP